MSKSLIIAASIIAISVPSAVLARGGGGSHSDHQPSKTNSASSGAGQSTTARMATGKRQHRPITVVRPAPRSVTRDVTVNKARTADKAQKSIDEYIRQ